jgi:outer membrane protein OmpA-like peptidoglycan-associated protein
MTMFKKIIILLLQASPFFATAQFGNIANRIKDKASQKITQRIDNKVDSAIDKTLGTGAGNKQAKAETTTKENNNNTVSKSTAEPGLESFSKYDFIPGEKVLYAEDFSQEAIAELPAAWNTNGSGEVVTLSNLPGKWLQMHKSVIYLSGNTKDLSGNYTVEFDLILQLKNNGWMYPTFSAGIFATNGEGYTDNAFLKEYNKYSSVEAIIYPAENSTSKVKIESFKEAKNYFTSEVKSYNELDKYYGKPVHIAIQVQRQRFRMWINETKIFDVPKGVDTANKMNQLFFKVGQTNYNENQYGIYISNIKTATGLPDTRHKLIDEGKFSTTGILFDINSSNIKSESYAVVKEIATALQDNPGIKIKITGHTSSDGDDKANMELSSKRAGAVKQLLVEEFKIDASAITTDGKGETEPIADNNTKEGRAQNRRVEFIKL